MGHSSLLPWVSNCALSNKNPKNYQSLYTIDHGLWTMVHPPTNMNYDPLTMNQHLNTRQMHLRHHATRTASSITFNSADI